MAITAATVSFSETQFALPESEDRARTRKIWYVRTSSVMLGLPEYARAVVEFENPETAKLNIDVSIMIPFSDMVPHYLDRPISIDMDAHPKLLQASTVCERMDKVTKVAVEVFFPCPLHNTYPMYGVGELCAKAFPNLNIEESSIYAIYDKNRWDCKPAFRPQTIKTFRLPPVPTPLNSQQGSA